MFNSSWIPQTSCSWTPWKAKANFVAWPLMELPSFVFGDSMRGQTQDFFARPPTFGIGSWRPSAFFCVRPLMDPSSIMLKSSMKGQGKFCCLASHGVSKLHTQRFRKRSNSKCFCLASHGAPKLLVQGFHERPN